MRRRAFTLIEIMVALIIVSALLAIMIPVVMDQARRGDPTRTGGDLAAITSALSMFRAHTLTWPDDLEDLVNPITVEDRRIDAEPYSSSQLERWDGPYLDAPMEATGPGDPASPDSIPTGFQAFVAPVTALYDGLRNDSLPLAAATDANFVAVILRGLDDEEFERLNDLIDGDAETDGTPECLRCSYDRGSLRYDPELGLTYYLAVPYRPET